MFGATILDVSDFTASVAPTTTVPRDAPHPDDDLTNTRRAFTASVMPMSTLTSDAVHPEVYWTCPTKTGGHP
jgi:hypothetical protein